jgi:RNase P subunit RPR2
MGKEVNPILFFYLKMNKNIYEHGKLNMNLVVCEKCGQPLDTDEFIIIRIKKHGRLIEDRFYCLKCSNLVLCSQ